VLQAFSAKQSELQGISSADLACGKRCTYLQLGRMQPRPVNVVGYSFVTFDRAVAVSVEVQRGFAGRSAGHVKLRQMQWRHTQAASGGLVQLLQPFKVRCSWWTAVMLLAHDLCCSMNCSMNVTLQACLQNKW
jgi:hypothetical protein